MLNYLMNSSNGNAPVIGNNNAALLQLRHVARMRRSSDTVRKSWIYKVELWLLRGILYTLEVLTIALGVNSCIYYGSRQKFQINFYLRAVVVFKNFVYFLDILRRTIENISAFCAPLPKLQGNDSLKGIYEIAALLLKLPKPFVHIFLVYLTTFQMQRIETVLQRCLSVYKEHRALFGGPLSINWLLCVATGTKLIVVEVIFAKHIEKDTNKAVLFILSAQLVLITLVTMVGVTLIHAMYANVGERQQPLPHSQLPRFYTFRMRLLRLSKDFESLARFIVGIELYTDVMLLVLQMHFIRKHNITHWYILLLLFVVISYVQKSNAIAKVQNTSHPSCSKRQALLWVLQQFHVDNQRHTYFAAFHLRSAFIVKVLNFIWMKSMILNIVFALTDVYSDRMEDQFFKSV